MKILAIDTSCDDTCIAILEIGKQPFGESARRRPGKLEIKSNIISSQVKIHRKYGGVYPTLAKREHQRNLLPVLIRALKGNKLLKISNSKIQTLKKILEREEYLGEELEKFLKKYQKPKVDAIAVTVGPGLEPCLWVGINFARSLSHYWDLPIVPVNHIEAHILANFLNTKYKIQNTKYLFPAVCLVVSGGHTQLILMKNFGQYKILGETRDDAAGECFDKTARILGLSYPGGPAIAAEAARLKIKDYRFQIKLPRPMINSKNYDFSFSGLKTAVLYKIKDYKPVASLPVISSKLRKLKIKDKNYIRAMCAEIQQAIIDVLIKKTIKATKDYKAKTIILGGGVAANTELRKQFKTTCLTPDVKRATSGVKLLIPAKNLCTDNAAMVGVAAYYHGLKGKTKAGRDIEANANLRISQNDQ